LEVALEDALTVLISGLVYFAIAALLAAILLVNLYAILHAWRRNRLGWAITLSVLFLAGGGIATAVYLFIHYDEPMPRSASSRRRAGIAPKLAHRSG
jgi:hypothetical protein